MRLEIGKTLGSYEVTSLLGKGGMGEVWRARDRRLERDVAIKALPDEFANDADRLARFEREAKLLASLNHPNIASAYGLESSGPTQFLVLELVEGETIADRITRGPIPVGEVVDIAKQICDALEAAHEKGIIHRDLKPANIKILPDGKVKVLDFGLAKAVERTTTRVDISQSPTLSMAATQQGLILGTAAYMSPEQASGKAVDKRTDIWALGCVLFEMLTARPAFEGEDVTRILARILEREPDWTLLPAGVPSRLKELLRLCLQKDVRKRRSDAADVRIDIEQALSVQTEMVPRPVPPTRERLPWILVAAVTLGFAALASVHFRETPAAAPEMRLEITTPSTSAPLEFELSPDGRYIVFSASGDGPQRLWLRTLDKTDAQPIAGTEGGAFPFWSPDSRSIAFVAAGKLERVDIAGGSPQILATTLAPRRGAWGRDGTILFTSGNPGALVKTPAIGGEVSAVTRLDPPRQITHVFPHFLPDGRHFLYYSLGTPETSGLYLASLDRGESKRLGAADSTGIYLPPGMVVFARGPTLMAQHLDLGREELTGDPVRIADAVGFNGIVGFDAFSVSDDGLLAYRATGVTLRQLKWYDRNGKAAGVAGDPDTGSPLYPELSPDGTHVALMRVAQGNNDIWLMDLIRGGISRFTFDTSVDLTSVWWPDGMRIAFASSKKGPFNIYSKASNGTGAEELLLESPNSAYPQDWSKDGRFLLYSEADPKTGRDLAALPVAGSDRKPIVVTRTPFDELNGQFSPDGHFVAYETNESGRFEIVVQSFPEPNGKWQVSTAGGTQPRWRADGKELYFVSLDGKLTAASINAGTTFSAGTPIALFPVKIAPGAGANKQQYAVSRDGRFLVNEPVETANPAPITVILNWKPKP
jgi:eukaryotic-like serine/threonine-protein kinase